MKRSFGELNTEVLKILFSQNNTELEHNREYGENIYKILKSTDSEKYKLEIENWISYLEQNNFELNCWSLPDMKHDLYVVYR